MSGDVQPRKRKEKRRKKDDLGVEEPRGTAATFGEGDVLMHSHHEHGTGGHWCAKIIFFSLLAVLVTLIGLIILENRGLSELEANAVESRYSGVLEGWIEDAPDDHHDEHTLELKHHRYEDNQDDGDDEELGELENEDKVYHEYDDTPDNSEHDDDTEHEIDEEQDIEEHEDDDDEEHDNDEDYEDDDDSDDHEDEDTTENVFEIADQDDEDVSDEQNVEEDNEDDETMEYNKYYKYKEHNDEEDDEDFESNDSQEEENENDSKENDEGYDDNKSNEIIKDNDDNNFSYENDIEDNTENYYNKNSELSEEDEEDLEEEIERIEKEFVDEVEEDTSQEESNIDSDLNNNKENTVKDIGETQEIENEEIGNTLESDEVIEANIVEQMTMPSGKPFVELEDEPSTEKPADTLAEEEEYEKRQEQIRLEKQESSSQMWMKLMVGGALLVATHAVIRRFTAPRDSPEAEDNTIHEDDPSLIDRRMTLIPKESVPLLPQDCLEQVQVEPVKTVVEHLKTVHSDTTYKREEEQVDKHEELVRMQEVPSPRKDVLDQELYSDDDDDEEIDEEYEIERKVKEYSKDTEAKVEKEVDQSETEEVPDDVEIIDDEQIDEEIEEEDEDEEEISDVDDAELLSRLEAKYGRLPEPERSGYSHKDGGNNIEDEWPGEPSEQYWRQQLDFAEEEIRQDWLD